VILHSLEDDHAVTRGFYPVLPYLEGIPDAQVLYLSFKQPLGRLRKASLRFTDTKREKSALRQAIDNKLFGEEIGLARPSPAVRPAIA